MNKELEKLGFKCYQIEGNTYFQKDELKLEKIYNGYLCEKPYKILKNIKEIKKLHNEL